MFVRAFPFIAFMFLLTPFSALAGTTYYHYELEISPASVRLLDQRMPDKDFSEKDLADLRMLARNIAAAKVLKSIETPGERVSLAVSLFRDGFIYGVLTNFMRQQFEKGFWRLGPELNILKNLLPVFMGFVAALMIQTRRWFEEAPKAEATLVQKLGLPKESVLEKFEPFYQEAYGVTFLKIDGCQIRARHLLYRLHQGGWFPGKVTSYYDPVFP